MTDQGVDIAIPILADRHVPASAFLDAARAYEASGVVDYMQGWDQLSSMFPPQLWNVGNAPMAALVPDLDSYPDFVAMLSAASVAAPGLGTALSTDAVRRGPAELMQTMLTLANLTQGRAQFHLGSGKSSSASPLVGSALRAGTSSRMCCGCRTCFGNMVRSPSISTASTGSCATPAWVERATIGLKYGGWAAARS